MLTVFWTRNNIYWWNWVSTIQVLKIICRQFLQLYSQHNQKPCFFSELLLIDSLLGPSLSSDPCLQFARVINLFFLLVRTPKHRVVVGGGGVFYYLCTLLHFIVISSRVHSAWSLWPRGGVPRGDNFAKKVKFVAAFFCSLLRASAWLSFLQQKKKNQRKCIISWFSFSRFWSLS